MPRKPSRRPTEAPTCPACGAQNVQIVQRVEDFHEADVHGQFKDEITKCEECGEELFTFEQAEAHSRAYAAAVARARNTLTPERIFELRMTLGRTQQEMEEAFGVGPKTWGRWERGVVAPSGPAARLLWFAENDAHAFIRMAEANRPGRIKSVKIAGGISQMGPGESALAFTTRAKPVRRSGIARSGNPGPTNGGSV